MVDTFWITTLLILVGSKSTVAFCYYCICSPSRFSTGNIRCSPPSPLGWPLSSIADAIRLCPMTPGSEFLDTTDFQGISIRKIQPFMASQMTTKHEDKKHMFNSEVMIYRGFVFGEENVKWFNCKLLCLAFSNAKYCRHERFSHFHSQTSSTISNFCAFFKAPCTAAMQSSGAVKKSTAWQSKKVKCHWKKITIYIQTYPNWGCSLTGDFNQYLHLHYQSHLLVPTKGPWHGWPHLGCSPFVQLVYCWYDKGERWCRISRLQMLWHFWVALSCLAMMFPAVL